MCRSPTLLLVGGQVGPSLDAGVGRRQYGVFRDDAESLLPFESLLANLVPPLIKSALVLRDELLRGVQWGMGCAEGEIGEERSASVRLLLVADVGDCAVAKVFGQVITGPRGSINEVVVLHQQRCPLVCFAAKEAIVLLEPHAERPAVERTSRSVRGVRG